MALTHTPEIKVNGVAVSAASIDAEVQYHPAASRREAMVKAAEQLVINEVLSQTAFNAGILSRPDRKLLEINPDILEALFDQQINIPKSKDEECLRYYEQNKEKFFTSPLVEADHILLVASPDDLILRAEMLELANKILEMVKSNQISFKQAVKQYSMCPSNQTGGNLGQLSSGQTVVEFERQIFAADIGLMQTPVETRFGYHIVNIARKVPGHALPFDIVSTKIKHYLDEKVRRKAISQYLHRLISEADIQGFAFDINNSMLMQ